VRAPPAEFPNAHGQGDKYKIGFPNVCPENDFSPSNIATNQESTWLHDCGIPTKSSTSLVVIKIGCIVLAMSPAMTMPAAGGRYLAIVSQKLSRSLE